MQKYLTMWENTVNASSEQPEDRVEHARACSGSRGVTASRAQFTTTLYTRVVHDHRAIHAEKLLGQPPAEWRRHPSGAEADGRFTGLAALENEPTRGESS